MSEYRGLVNEGATCYLNSLVQTLFMTPEFRRNVYKYAHDSRKIAEIDSIPYQLQKLFVKLQENTGAVYTKGLRRSFQWNDAESFQQHDVQQFCRILFQAIEKVFKGDNWIERLYSGTVVSYISCGQHMRENPQIYMDLSLPIRNLATNAYYKSIEECLKEYIKPEKLEDKVQCEECGERVQVEKGMKFTILPPILTLQLNRFELNYENFQRQKINTFVYYPQILSMDKFLKPFEEVQISPIPKGLEEGTKLQAKEKSARTMQWGDLSVVGKGIKRKNSDEIEAKKEKVKFFDEENKDKRDDVLKQLSKQEELNKNKQIMQDLKAGWKKSTKKGEKEKSSQKVSEETENKQGNLSQKKGEQAQQNKIEEKIEEKKDSKKEEKPYDPLQDDMLFGTFMEGIPKNQKQPCSFDDGPNFEKTIATFEHEEEIFDLDKDYEANTYILYSILVHNGGAYGGHYYAYIFNGQNWYCFNDTSVTKASRKEIRKYGHPSQKSSYGTNAYLLFYYQSTKFKQAILNSQIEIPQQILEKIQKDKVDITKQEENPVADRCRMINKKSLFKVYWYGNRNTREQEQNNSEHEIIVIDDRYETKVGDLRSKVKEMFAGKLDGIDERNWRMRRYNQKEDSVHDTYNLKDGQFSLDSFGLRETCYLAVQTKEDNEQFQQYDPKNITIKLNIWRNDLTLLTEQYLKPKKMSIRDEKTFKEFYEKVEKITGLKNPVVIKRTFSSGKAYEEYPLEANQDKTLISLRFFNGINLYVEPENISKGKLLWDQQFETERYRCLIKYNNPKLGQEKNQQIFFDTRKTLGELKTALSDKIGIPFEEFRIKKAQQAVSEMITYKKKLVDLRFVNNQYLYLEEGKSSKGSLPIKRGFVSVVDDQIDFTLGEEVLIELDSSLTTCADVKNVLAARVSVQPFNIRIREYKSFQFGQIFNDCATVQVMKDKSLVWEQIEEEDPRGLQVYVRVFDVMTLELGPLITTFIDSSANYEQMTYILEEETQIQADKMLAWRATSNFIDKSLLFDIEWHETRFWPKPIREQPMYLSKDGEIIIVKEAETAYHAKPIKRGGEYPSSRPKDSQDSGYYKKRETGMKITVVEQKQLDPEEQPEQKQQEKSEQQQQTSNQGHSEDPPTQ